MSVKVNDMCYMWSADENIASKGEYGGAVTTLITDPNEIEKSAGSLHCGTVNLAKVVERYLDGLKDMKIVVTCKPCDAMTLRELIKKGRVIEDNLIMVGVNCGGTMPPNKTRIMIDQIYDLDPDDVVKEEIAKGKLIIETENDEKEISIDDLEEDGWG